MQQPPGGWGPPPGGGWGGQPGYPSQGYGHTQAPPQGHPHGGAPRAPDPASIEGATWPGPRWQYRVLRSRSVEQEELNRIGAQGWELVATEPEAGLLMLLFKRQIPPR